MSTIITLQRHLSRAFCAEWYVPAAFVVRSDILFAGLEIAGGLPIAHAPNAICCRWYPDCSLECVPIHISSHRYSSLCPKCKAAAGDAHACLAAIHSMHTQASHAHQVLHSVRQSQPSGIAGTVLLLYIFIKCMRIDVIVGARHAVTAQ